MKVDLFLGIPYQMVPSTNLLMNQLTVGQRRLPKNKNRLRLQFELLYLRQLHQIRCLAMLEVVS